MTDLTIKHIGTVRKYDDSYLITFHFNDNIKKAYSTKCDPFKYTNIFDNIKNISKNKHYFSNNRHFFQRLKDINNKPLIVDNNKYVILVDNSKIKFIDFELINKIITT